MLLKRPLVVALIALTLLSACQSREEKAESYFQSGAALAQAGDLQGAILEFRNALRFDATHKQARLGFAQALLAQGKDKDAYIQLIRYIELYPDTADVRAQLAEMAITSGNWDEARRHGEQAIKLAPDTPRAKAIKLALTYRKAVTDRDTAGQVALVDRANGVLAGDQANPLARRIVIDAKLNGPDPLSALPDIQAALKDEPNSYDLNGMLLTLLAQTPDKAATVAQIEHMITLFPEDAGLQDALLEWHLRHNDFAAAEAVLRSRAGDPAVDLDGNAALVNFVAEQRGETAAADDLNRLITATDGTTAQGFYKGLLATLAFDAGRQDQAIADLQAVLADLPADPVTTRLQVMLAQMYQRAGQSDAAMAQVDTILASDPANPAALKLRAKARIAADEPGKAIVDLRSVLDQNSRDVEALTLIAEAHLRDAQPELAGERLATATEVSGNDPAVALSYAQFLLAQGNPRAALVVLDDALADHPADLTLLTGLTELHLRESRFADADLTIARIAALPDAVASDVADRFRIAAHLAQNQPDAALDDLSRMIAKGSAGPSDVLALLDNLLADQHIPQAQALVAQAQAKTPDDPIWQVLQALILQQSGDTEGALVAYRAVLAATPDQAMAAELLHDLLQANGRMDEAAAVLATALAAAPQSTALRKLQAIDAERAGDLAGAIALYQALNRDFPDDLMVINNLGNALVAAHGDDPAVLEQAATLTQRLHGMSVPAFQDTYGWIALLRGDLETALSALEPAARGLPDDAAAQYHLGRLYEALSRREDAIEFYDRALTAPNPASADVMQDAQSRRDALADDL